MRRPLEFLKALILVLAIAAVLFAAAETLIVKLQTTNLRKDPKFYAQTVAVLRAGENVQKLGSQGAWLQVRSSGGAVGWIHSSSVEDKKLSLAALGGSTKTEASASEVALAGKGFNKQVEQSYRAKNPKADYAQVDSMLKITVPVSEILAFLKQGKLGEFRRAK